MTASPCSRLALKAAVHGLALTALCVALSIMHVVVKPFPRKFFCDDQSILYPRGGCTVPYYICAPIGVLAAWLTVAAVEYRRTEWPRWGGGAQQEPRHLQSLLRVARRMFSTEFRARYFSAVLYGVYHFCLGLAACDFLMGMAKNVFGRHRPFFYAVCRPQLPGGCNSSVAYDVSVCRPAAGSERDFLDAQRSFPSGHASFGLYCAVFIVLYLQRRSLRSCADGGCSPIARQAVQFAAATGGLYVAYSRVPDYKHHWSDVLAGGLLGACLAWAAARAVPEASAAAEATTAAGASESWSEKAAGGASEETMAEVA